MQVEKNGLLFSSSSELADELLVSLSTWLDVLPLQINFKYTGSNCMKVLLVCLLGCFGCYIKMIEIIQAYIAFYS